MDERRADSLALRLSLGILRIARPLVPRAIRDGWMREWEAEVRHRSSSMQRRCADLRWQQQADLVKQSSGAFADAAFLRRQLIAHYLITALRHCRRHKAITAVNVSCLALGLACFVVAWGTTAYFAQADHHQPNASRLYVVIMRDASNDYEPVLPVSSRLLAESLAADFPQLEAVARATPPKEVPVSVGDTSRFANAVFADPPLLEMLHLPMLAAATSETQMLLDAPGSAVITSSFATRLFGTDEVVGRTLRLGGGTSADNVTITGVVGALEQPSLFATDMSAGALPFALRFDVILSSDLLPDLLADHRWTSRSCYTYVMLPSDGSFTVEAFNEQLDAFARRNVPADGISVLAFEARPISTVTQIWLNGLAGANVTGISSAAVLMMLGGLVLLVACFNYANLATAEALARAREVAMRRVLGAERAQIAIQHVVEGLVLTTFALALALACLAATMLVVGPDLFFAVLDVLLPMPQLWGLLAALVAAVTLGASAYPAIALCRVPPAEVHRGSRATGRARFSSLLVGLQFALAGFLLVSVFVMSAQNRAMRAAIGNPGDDPVVVIANDIRNLGVDQELLKTQLARQRGVRAVGAIDFVPWGTSFSFADLAATADATASLVNSSKEIVDPEFFEAMGIRFVAGRNFDAARSADTADVAAWNAARGAAPDYNVVIGRDMVRRMGLGSPEEAVGKPIYRPVSQSGATPPQRLRVIGVVENAVIQPLNFGAPVFYLMNRDAADVPVIRIAQHDVAGALAAVDSVWEQLAPGVPLRRRFANEQFEASYGFLDVVDEVIAALGVFASVIATMGLIGISLHTLRRRTREIAVRKVHGASGGQVVWMLLAQLSKPIVIANLAAWPVAYAVMYGYLSLFAVRSGLGVMPFVLSLLIALAVAWLAVLTQATRAARASPGLVLRAE